jgi:hypothetical protein
VLWKAAVLADIFRDLYQSHPTSGAIVFSHMYMSLAVALMSPFGVVRRKYLRRRMSQSDPRLRL